MLNSTLRAGVGDSPYAQVGLDDSSSSLRQHKDVSGRFRSLAQRRRSLQSAKASRGGSSAKIQILAAALQNQKSITPLPWCAT